MEQLLDGVKNIPIAVWLVLTGVIVLTIVVKIFWLKVPVDKAVIITGFNKRTLIGKGGFIVPWFETYCIVSLESISMNIEVGALAKGDINVSLNGVAVVKIDDTVDSVSAATVRFCNDGDAETSEKIREVTSQIIEGELRGSASQLTPEDINSSREKFEGDIKKNVEEKLSEMGLKLDSYTLKSIETPDGYFKNKTETMIAQSKSIADISQAERKRDTDIKTSVANKEAKETQIINEITIAEKNKNKEVSQQEFNAAQEKARVDSEAIVELQRIDQKKNIAVEKTKLAELEALALEKQLEIEKIKPAEADKKEQIIEAEKDKATRIKEAEANSEQILLEARARAEARSLEAKAEAEYIESIGKATAISIEKKAEAYQKYNNAAMLEMLVPVLGEIGKATAESIKSIDKVSIIGSSDGSEINNFAATTARNIQSSKDVVKDLTGINIEDILKGYTYDAKVNRNVKLDMEDMDKTKKIVSTIPIIAEDLPAPE